MTAGISLFYYDINMKNKKFGFTLIELLIVIALLGALAVGLLAALDPFEQFKKGDDTGVRNTVSEIQGAAIRFYSTRNQMPWGTGDQTLIDASTGYTTVGLDQVVDAGELKSDFSTLAGGKLNQISVMGTSESVTVCFKPLSKSFRSDRNTKYTNTGGIFTALPSTSGGECGDTGSASFSCFWCIY